MTQTDYLDLCQRIAHRKRRGPGAAVAVFLRPDIYQQVRDILDQRGDGEQPIRFECLTATAREGLADEFEIAFTGRELTGEDE